MIALLILVAAKTYHFDCEYINSSTRGVIQSRTMVSGDFIESAPDQAKWENVSISQAQGEGAFGTASAQAYMNGFTYDPGKVEDEFNPEFFKAFPPNAVQAQNLVWDTTMFLQFAKKSAALKLGVPTSFLSGSVNLAGKGTFRNKNVELTRMGTAKVDGVDCDLYKYDAFFNSIDMKMSGGIGLVGRSHYWGEYYLRAGTNELQTGTLYEDVLGELTIGTNAPQTINVLRKGSIHLNR